MLGPLNVHMLQELFAEQLHYHRAVSDETNRPDLDIYVANAPTTIGMWPQESRPYVRILTDGEVVVRLQMAFYQAGVLWDVKEQDVIVGNVRKPNFYPFIVGWVYAINEVRACPSNDIEYILPNELECRKVQALKTPKWAGDYAYHCLTKSRLGRHVANANASHARLKDLSAHRATQL